ncbi:MAG TPA: hypothetical protein VKV20_06345 [Ktedonobacteraceae bacterium]|jgi:hypothetical protein|nr:hypothetical protein [Ktedonobacteraceae bacterium]
MATLNTGRRPRSPDFDWVVEKIFVGNEAERLELLDRLKHFMAHMGDHGGIPRLYDYDKRLPQSLPKGSSRTYTITWFETPGISLEEEYCQKNKHITIDKLLECERQITAALIPMHRAELPHLDIQPDNIMLVNRTELARTGTTGPVYVLRRWGLGKFSLASYDDKSWPFLPPEIDNADLEGPGTASDLYLLAVTLLILYTGRGIFARTETGFEEIRRQHQQEEPDLTGLPPQFRPLFREALAKNPAERPSIEEFRDRFEQAYRAMTARPSRVDTLTETAALIKAVAGKSMTRRAAIALLVMIPLFVLAVAAWNLLQSFAASKRHVLAGGGVGTTLYTFPKHASDVNVARPALNGRTTLSADEGGRLMVWLLASQKIIFSDHLESLTALGETSC